MWENTRRTANIFLSQPVALAAGLVILARPLLLLLQQGASQLLLKSKHALVWPVHHGQFPSWLAANEVHIRLIAATEYQGNNTDAKSDGSGRSQPDAGDVAEITVRCEDGVAAGFKIGEQRKK